MLWGSMALALGFVHGLGADHLMAIATLAVAPAESTGQRQARAFRAALGFAVGHALFLAMATAVVLIVGWSIPPLVERGGEAVGGVLLIMMGAAGLLGLGTGRFYGHAHSADGPLMGGWHLHLGRRHPVPGAHTALPTLLGAAFAVSSLRTLSMLEPFGDAARTLGSQSLLSVLALIGIFGAGVLLAMCLFGILLVHLLSTRAMNNLGHVAATMTSIGAIGLGTYWLVA